MSMYPFGLSALLAGDVAYDSDTINVALVMTGAAGYTYSTAHSGFSQVPAYARAANGIGTLASKNISASGSGLIFDAADTTLSSVTGAASGAVFHAVVQYRSGASEAQSVLLNYNTLDAPITANGGNITLAYNGAGVFNIWTDS